MTYFLERFLLSACSFPFMLEKFLSEYVSAVAGSGADKIVAILFKKKNVNEFLIAKKLNMTINQTRNILYKLADSGLVHFMRKKDLKSGGWYTYFWTLDDYKCLVNYRNSLLKEIEQQEHSLQTMKTKQFFVCKTCGTEVMEEQALLHDFTCVECGQVYSLKDSTESVKEMEKLINKLRDRVELIKIEIDKLAVSISFNESKQSKVVKKGKKKFVKSKKKIKKKIAKKNIKKNKSIKRKK